jgi:CheY-like chemotaxis protein
MTSQTKVLHVEDSPDDVLLLELAFNKAGITAKLEAATDGDQAIAALQRNAGSQPPNCVLLDLKLPGISGLEVLEWIRQHPKLKRLPVIILTSSLLPEDIRTAYDLGANSYLSKPPDLATLTALVKAVDQYWLHTNVPAAAP